MKTDIQKIHEISVFIRKNGVLVNEAKSAYGADRWKFGLVLTSIEDEGYTTCVYSENLGLIIADCCGKIDCRKGKIENLDIFYNNLFGKLNES